MKPNAFQELIEKAWARGHGYLDGIGAKPMDTERGNALDMMAQMSRVSIETSWDDITNKLSQVIKAGEDREFRAQVGKTFKRDTPFMGLFAEAGPKSFKLNALTAKVKEALKPQKVDLGPLRWTRFLLPADTSLDETLHKLDALGISRDVLLCDKDLSTTSIAYKNYPIQGAAAERSLEILADTVRSATKQGLLKKFFVVDPMAELPEVPGKDL